MPDFPSKNANNCTHCGGKLVAIGTARSNGKNHDDWTGRTLHKKCWKELQELQDAPSEKATNWFKSLAYLIKE